MTDILVIGYGNELRGDDGLGLAVVEAIAVANLPGVRMRTAIQLLPEWAVDLAEVRLVVFVDASLESCLNGVEVRRLNAEDLPEWSTHFSDPRALLALTQAIYGRAPEAWWATVPGTDFRFGRKLSLLGEENAERATKRILTLIREKLATS